MSLKGDAIAVGIAGVVLLAAGWYAKKKAGEAADALAKLAQEGIDAAKKALPYVDPTDDRNLAYQGANGFYQAVTGDKVGTLGTGIYDATHEGGVLENMDWWQLANPAAAVGGVIGNSIGKRWSPGTQIYDWLH